MELQHLRTFLAVAAAGSVTRAAQQLFLTPPSVSAHIRALEEHVGVALFLRTPGGMRLTSAGAALRASAEQTLAAADEFQHQAAQLRGQPAGRVALGLNATAEFLRVGALFSELRREYPAIELACSMSATNRIVADLRAGSLDLGFVFGELLERDLATVALGMAELVVAVPCDWALAARAEGWAELADLPWIGSKAPCPFQDLLHAIFSKHRLQYRHAAHTCDEDASRPDLVRVGAGLSLLERREAERAAASGELLIWEGETIDCPLSLACLAARAGEPAIRAVRSTIAALWQPSTSAAEHWQVAVARL